MSISKIPRSWVAAAAAVAALSLGALAPPAMAQQAHLTAHPSAGQGTSAAPTRQVCPTPTTARTASCFALVRTDIQSHKGLFRRGMTAQDEPAGYGPSDLASAYDLPASSTDSPTVAVVDAYGNPNAEADLQVYRAQYGLPVCDTANGCFEKVNQEGEQSHYPAPDPSWAEEQSLDVDMVSAICPNCHIILVQAKSASLTNLFDAEDEAVALGAKYVSNSWGSSGEASNEASYDPYFNHPGVVITASAGDSGYGVHYPAASPYVTSIGGTSLTQDPGTARGWTESVWSTSASEGTGSGCSAYEPKPAWQTDTGCTNRTDNDVSADADPATGVAVYDSYEQGGWSEYGGTSVASPIIAATYALAGLPEQSTYPAQYPYSAVAAGDTSALNDVTTGANATSCDPTYLCTAGPGYDGPTGLGTPNGVQALAYAQSGTVTGTVTDASTGQPIVGAQVSVPGLSTTTGSDGSYTLTLPPASYPLTLSAYGYASQTDTVPVTANTATTQNVQLAALARATVHGTVKDGSGQGWPLYAKVTWTDPDGHTGSVFTDPATGAYKLSLVSSSTYTLQVSAVYSGYQVTTKRLQVGTSNMTRNVALTVDPIACDAPGYHPAYSGTTQPFVAGQAHPALDGKLQQFTSNGVPAGWRATNVNLHIPYHSDKPGWVFDNPAGRDNNTGGDGNFAIVDSAYDGAANYQDAYLTSPSTNMSAYQNPAIQFDTDLEPASNSTATVQVSTDGGQTWNSVWTNAGLPGVPGPAQVVLPLPQLVGQQNVQVRFGYTGQWSQYWEIDDVFLGNRTCVAQSGGLVVGQVTDSASNTAINGATVASVTNPNETTTTVATPGDTVLNGGIYWLFAAGGGSQQFTATDTGFSTATQSATVTAGQLTQLNFALTASS
ncbi:MAG TPA: carboxypeptidase regulatory-like domain-containing protein [Streptosporangiaceae bacterium]|jgi:hypothetical protein